MIKNWMPFIWVLVLTSYIIIDYHNDKKNWKRQVEYKHLMDSTYVDHCRTIDVLQSSLDTCRKYNIWLEHEGNLAENEISQIDWELYEAKEIIKKLKNGN